MKAPEAAKVKLDCVRAFLLPTDIQIHVSWGTRLASHGQGCYRSKGLEANSDHVIVILSKANPDRDVKDARHHQPHIIPRQRLLEAIGVL